MMLNSEELNLVFSIVKDTVEHAFKHDAIPNIDPEGIPFNLREHANVLITFSYRDTVFGLEGNIDNFLPLYKSVSMAALTAGFRNTKLTQINKNILDQILVDIYFLLVNRKFVQAVDIDNFCLDLKTSECVLIQSNDKSFFGTPEVQKDYENKHLFMDFLKRSATISKDTPWSEIRATSIPVTHHYSKLFKDISCPSSD